MMKHPDLLYPKRKAAEFDMNGRPFNSLFYTSKPNYFKAMNVSTDCNDANYFKSLDHSLIYAGCSYKTWSSRQTRRQTHETDWNCSSGK